MSFAPLTFLQLFFHDAATTYFFVMARFQNLYNRLNGDFHTWDFTECDLFSCINGGIIIEEYSDDLPFPSILINGKSLAGRAMHVVIGIDSASKRLYIITVYNRIR